MKTQYDIVIIGARPAGSVLAHKLATHGLQVLIIEKLTCLATRPAVVGWLIIFSANQLAVEYDNLFVKLEEVHMWKRKRWNELSICQKVVIALLSALQFIMLAAALWDIHQRSEDE
ncbi:MAG: FAD-dependent monooxygenase, partial [Anaerolineales bacterium]|nr:FAD-dependent monooxygenase [Anaerolineales bacterium]